MIEEALNILYCVLTKNCLSDTQEAVFCEAWAGKTYEEIAAELNFAVDYIKAVGAELWKLLTDALGQRVSKNNFRSVIIRWARERPGTGRLSPLPPTVHQDWGEAVDVSTFFGRTEELSTITDWIVTERCRIVALLGMGGMGKTSLSVKVAQQVQQNFDWLIWRSLRNAPPLQELLRHILQFLANGDGRELTDDLNGQLSQLIEYLKTRRCLLILDNAEVILQAGETPLPRSSHYAGHYRDGYENYGDFFQCIGQVSHQSCLLLTSREEPREIDILKGEAQPVRSLQLQGLTATAGQELFRIRGKFTAADDEWNRLIQHYAGNPLALKMVASIIKDLFDSNVSKFLYILDQNLLVFDDIRDVLQRQFDRLSDDEKTVMFWLAINREPLTLIELQDHILSPALKRRLPEVLKSLGRRSVIERRAQGFTQQPVVMEYLIEQLVEQICQEICANEIHYLANHALLMTQAKSYVRDSQGRLILQAVGDRLRELLQTTKNIETKLKQLLLKLQTEFAQTDGYAAGNLLNLLRHLDIDVTGYDFSQLVMWQANLQGLRLYEVNFTGCNFAKSAFTETLSSIWAVALSSDGKLLAASDTLEHIYLWQVADGKKLFTFTGHQNWSNAIAFSPDSRLLASIGGDAAIKLWDTTTGQCLKTLSGHQNWGLALAFSPDGRYLASSAADGTVKLWEVRTGDCLQTLAGHGDWVRSLAFMPSSPRTEFLTALDPPITVEPLLITGSADDTVRVWDSRSGHCLQTWRTDSGGVWAIAVSPDGSTLATGSADTTIKLWRLPDGQPIHTLVGHTNVVKSLSFSADGSWLASGSEDQTIRLWHGQTGECLKVLRGHTSGVWAIACAGNHLLASGGPDQQVKLWHLRSGQCLSTHQGYTDFILALAVTPPVADPVASGGCTSSLLAVASADHSIKLWDINAGKCQRVLQGHTNWVLSVAFDRHSQTLASAGFDQTIRLWNVPTGQCTHVLRGHPHWVLAVKFHPTNQTLASCGFDRTIRLWDSQTGECLKVLEGHDGRLFAIAFNPPGTLLASAGDDLIIRLWQPQSGVCMQTFSGHSERIWTVAFSPDGQLLASGSSDRTIRIWDVATGKCLHVLHGHTSRVQSVAFSGDGQLLVSGSEDQTIRLWHPVTGHHLQTCYGHTQRVWATIFGQVDFGQVDLGQIDPESGASDPGDRPSSRSTLDPSTVMPVVISGGEDELIRLWEPRTGTCLKTFSTPKPYQGMDITGVTGLTVAEKETLKSLGAIDLLIT